MYNVEEKYNTINVSLLFIVKLYKRLNVLNKFINLIVWNKIIIFHIKLLTKALISRQYDAEDFKGSSQLGHHHAERPVRETATY